MAVPRRTRRARDCGVFDMPPEPLNYATPAPAVSRHNLIYTIVLIVFAFFCAVGMIGMTFMSRNPRIAPESRWVFQMTVAVYALLLAAMVTTLILRGVAPRAGRIATKSLNIILLIVIPFGTVIGIYGLIKVD